MLSDIKKLKKQIMSNWADESAEGLGGSTLSCNFCGECIGHWTGAYEAFKHKDNCAVLLIEKIEHEEEDAHRNRAQAIELNEFGLAVWKHRKHHDHFLERPYSFVDSIVEINELGNNRTIVNQGDFSSFDFTDWEPMTRIEYSIVKKRYKEIYGAR